MSIGSEMLPDNPAARLQSFLERIQKAKHNGNEQISAVFSRILDVEDKPSEVLPHYSQLFVLIDDAYNKVTEYYPKQQKLHTGWRTYFTDVFQKHSPYHHQWPAIKTALIQGGYLELIQVANDNLEHFVRPTQVNGLTVADLEVEVSKLIIEIEASNELSSYLKIFLIEELHKILEYIKHFDLYGSDPIRKSIYNIVGNTEVSKKFACKAIAGVSALLVMVASSIGVINDVSSFPESLEKLKTEFYLPYVEASPTVHSDNVPESEVLLEPEVEK
ncbi:hypothetical protein QNE55_004113 [Vibrio vulnificus]|nr:hypothetical protein [Vibrio vulnificus]